MRTIIFSIIAVITFPVFSQTFNRVDQDIKNFDTVIQKKKDDFNKILFNPNNKEWVKKKLIHMVDIDQYARDGFKTPSNNHYSSDEKKYFWKIFPPRISQIDQNNTTDLKSLLKIYTWIKISEFGDIADGNAWLLVQHADHDVDFQKTVLIILEKLYPIHETRSDNYAYLYDRICASWHDISKQKPQLYGTQGKCISDGKWEPIPIEKSEKVDERRKIMGMATMKDYIERMNKVCIGLGA